MLPIQHPFPYPLVSFPNIEAGNTRIAFANLTWIQVSRSDLDLADHMHMQNTERQKCDRVHVEAAFAISPGKDRYLGICYFVQHINSCVMSVTGFRKAERQGTNTSLAGTDCSRYNVVLETRTKTIFLFLFHFFLIIVVC